MRKVAVITTGPEPDYIRARTLRAALQTLPNVQIIVVKNSTKKIWRYIQMIGRIWRVRLRENPDVYLLTFRGYELLWWVQIVAGRKPVIFDEFINLTEWLVDEHHLVAKNSWLEKVINNWYGRRLRHCALILADTKAHAHVSAARSHVPLEKYVAIPVSTDETLFKPLAGKTPKTTSFQILYYGSMLPLHGLPIVLQAAEQLKDEPKISFLLVGGGEKTEKLVAAAVTKGARVTYKKWIPFDELPVAIDQSSVCLAGPFGDTPQAQLVVTGKAYQFLACAAPTIIGQNLASGDFINRHNALVVPQANVPALAEAIRWAFNHPAELAAIGQAGRALYDQKFSIKIIAAQLAVALQRLPSDRRAAADGHGSPTP